MTFGITRINHVSYARGNIRANPSPAASHYLPLYPITVYKNIIYIRMHHKYNFYIIYSIYYVLFVTID